MVTTPSAAKEGAKNGHTMSLLGILLELYLLFWHKQAISTLTLPWLSNHCSISAPTLKHDLLTYHSLLIPHLATTVPTPPSEQTSTSPGPHLHPRPPKLKTFSTQSLPMHITTFSIMNKANLDVHTNPPPPPHPSFTVMTSLAKCIKKTWSSSLSPLTPGHNSDLCYKHSSPPPTIPVRNPGAPPTPTLNITTPMPTSCTNEPPNHHAHLVSSHQPTYVGVNPPHPHAKKSLVTHTLHSHQVYIHFNSLDSAFQKHLAHYYAMLPVRSNFLPLPLHLTYTHSSLWKIHTP
jgi:hypothetical protein